MYLQSLVIKHLHVPPQVVTGLTLLLICVLAFSVRLFSVIKYESVIHEFDPYFNYRVTKFLTEARRPLPYSHPFL